jgi:hypothetical protein
MGTISLTNLRAKARLYADQRVAGFVANSENELDTFLNDGLQEIHELLSEAMNEQYQVKEVTFTYTGADLNLQTTCLAAANKPDFYKLLGVTLNINGNPTTITPLSRNDRNAYQDYPFISYLSEECHYILLGNTLRFTPVQPTTTGSLIYLPLPQVQVASPASIRTDLLNATDTITLPGGFERYIYLYAAKQLKLLEETSVTETERELEKLRDQIKELKAKRDLNGPKHAQDVFGLIY